MNYSRVFSLLPGVVECGEPYPIEENPPDATHFYFSITILFVLFVASTQAFASDTVRVFILAGQSNMVGAGRSNPIHLVTMEKVHSNGSRKLIYQR